MRTVTVIENEKRGEHEQLMWRTRATRVMANAGGSGGDGKRERWQTQMVAVVNVSNGEHDRKRWWWQRT